MQSSRSMLWVRQTQRSDMHLHEEFNSCLWKAARGCTLCVGQTQVATIETTTGIHRTSEVEPSCMLSCRKTSGHCSDCQ